jgi:hypothetical protein
MRGDTKQLKDTFPKDRSTNLRRTPTVNRSTGQLQKVVWGLASHVWLDLPRCWIELEEVLIHILSNFENCSHVTTTITVIRCAEHCDNVLILHHTIKDSVGNIPNRYP